MTDTTGSGRDEELKEKYRTITKLLDEEFVLVHVRPKSEGVDVPPRLRTASTVTLKLSRRFKGKLVVTSSSVEADLLFDSDYYHCVLPLGAIWAVSGPWGSTIVWDSPASEHEGRETAPPAAAPVGADDADPGPDVSKKKGGHLRRVK